jgi:hypothetical protein
MEPKSTFALYIHAIWRDWVAKFSGIAAAILTVLGAFFPIERWEIFVAAALCYVLASFSVWRAEHRGRVRAEGLANDERSSAESQVAELRTELTAAETRLADERANKRSTDEIVLMAARHDYRGLQKGFHDRMPPRDILTDTWAQRVADKHGLAAQDVIDAIERLDGKFHWQV